MICGETSCTNYGCCKEEEKVVQEKKETPFHGCVVGAVQRSSQTWEFGRSDPICQSQGDHRPKGARGLATRFGVHVAQTETASISHVTRDGVWDGRAMDGRSDRGDKHCQVKSRVQISLDGGGRVFQVRLGRTREEQDGKGDNGRHGQDLETQRGEKTHESSDG